MAFKFNAILKFNSAAATKNLNKTGKAFARLRKGIGKASQSMAKMGEGIRGLAIASAPAAAGVAFATKTFADFEFQMKTVQSVLLATDEEMKELNQTTKLMGATTEFSARQAGQGAESLARAGLVTKDIIGALPGVLAAASAGNIELAEATNIVIGQIGAFGLKASDASEVADQLALTTALTNTNFTQLGESMKFAAPIASQAGISLSETATAMGVLANAGVKGSIAGTALKNAITKLAKPTKQSLELFGGRKGFNEAMIETVEVNGRLVQKMRPLEVVMANVSKVVGDSADPLQAAGKAAEIFGLRGTTAFSSFQKALTNVIPITEKNREAIVKGAKATGTNIDEFIKDGAIPQLVALRLNIAGAAGTARQMRDIKMDSLTGQFILLKSAFEGINIEIGGIFAGITRNLVGKTTDFLSVLVVGFQAAKDGGKATEAQMKALKDNQFAEMIPMAIEFAQGFIQGFKEVKDTVVSTFKTVTKWMGETFGDVNMTNKEIGNLVAKIVTVGAIAAPILAGLAAFFFVLGPIIAGVSGAIGFIGSALSIMWSVGTVVLSGLATFFSVLLSPIGLVVTAIAGIGLVIAGIVENWENVKTAFMDKGIIDGFKAIGDGIMKFLNRPLDAVKEKWNSIKSFFGAGDESAQVSGSPAGEVGRETDSASDAVKESAKIQKESLTQTATAQPASAQQIGQQVVAAQASTQSQGAAPAGGGTQRIELSFRGDAKKVLNKMVTGSQVENSALQGRTPLNKRKLLQNGAAANGS